MTYTLDEVIEMAERTDKLIERSEFHKDATEYLKRYREMRWHYPSKGEFPKESGDFLCCFYGLTSFKVGWYDKTDQSWCFENCIYYKDGADNIIAWQYIIPPQEEA